MRASRSQLALIAAAAAMVVGVVAYGTAGTSHGSPTAISTPSLSPAELKATSARVTAWIKGPAGNHLVKLNDAMDALNGKTATSEVANDCEAITIAEITAQADPPIPDTPAQSHWALALEAVKRGALSCSAGAERGDPNGIAIGFHALQQSTKELDALAERLNALTHAE